MIDCTVRRKSKTAGQPDCSSSSTPSGGRGVTSFLVNFPPDRGLNVIVGRSVYRASPPRFSSSGPGNKNKTLAERPVSSSYWLITDVTSRNAGVSA